MFGALYMYISALHLKQTFPSMIWIFTEGDGIKSRLPFKIFSTIPVQFLENSSSLKDWNFGDFFVKLWCIILRKVLCNLIIILAQLCITCQMNKVCVCSSSSVDGSWFDSVTYVWCQASLAFLILYFKCTYVGSF